jgi:hypothetical protein
MSQLAGSQITQLGVDQRQQLLSGVWFALFDLVQNAKDSAHWRLGGTPRWLLAQVMEGRRSARRFKV